MRNVGRIAVILLLLAAGPIGCRSGPSLLEPPGTVQRQRANAAMFDPYADNEIGPEVVGGRPRDFQKPLSDPERSRLFHKIWWPF